MPISTETPRCSEFARSIDVLPPGTGLFLERVILVTAPLPWPKPALQHDYLKAASAHVMASTVPSRLFAAEPIDDQLRVEVFERDGSGASRSSWVLDEEGSIEPLIAAIGSAAVGSLSTVSILGCTQDQADQTPVPTFLVCTQGSHDSCCGTSGVALSGQIEADRPDYVVRRVSHTGGHRFSPTFLAFPEGRMWAFADLELVDRVATGTATANDHRQHARGWWGAKVGPAQVAECAVRAERALESFVAPVVEALDVGSDNTKTFSVVVDDESWRVAVTVGREIPTIACEMPGGLPVKPGREFAWSIART